MGVRIRNGSISPGMEKDLIGYDYDTLNLPPVTTTLADANPTVFK